MFPNSPNVFSLTRIISGVSRTLKIAQDIIPIYQNVKPIVSNAQKAFSHLKELNISPVVKPQSQINLEKSQNKSATIKSSTVNNPTFFT